MIPNKEITATSAQDKIFLNMGKQKIDEPFPEKFLHQKARMFQQKNVIC